MINRKIESKLDRAALICDIIRVLIKYGFVKDISLTYAEMRLQYFAERSENKSPRVIKQELSMKYDLTVDQIQSMIYNPDKIYKLVDFSHK